MAVDKGSGEFLTGTPLVSVVIPAFNAATTLGETLDSVLAQTCTEWEALIVDDRSNDDTPAIAEAFAQRDKRFTALQGPGKGVSMARNTGLARARGEWLLFLDADDWISPSHLERMLAAVTERPDVAAAYCGSRRVLPDGRMTSNTTDGSLASKPFETLTRSCHVAIHSVLVSRRIVTELGGFDQLLRTCEDWDLWQRVARLGKPWIHVDEVLSYYRVRESSLSGDFTPLLLDSETVVRRGFGPDKRVHEPDPAFAAGAPDDDGTAADRAIAEVALWFGSLASVSGDSTLAATQILGRLPPPSPGDASAMAETMLHAAARVLGVTPGSLATRWQAFGPALTKLIEDLGIGWSDVVASRRLLYHLDRAILEHSDSLAKPVSLGLTQGRRLNLWPFDRIRTEGDIDRLHLRIVIGPWRGHFADVGVLGPLTRRRQIGILLDYLAAGPIRATDPMTWPGPAIRLTLHLCRRAGRVLKRRLGAGNMSGGSQHTAALREIQRRVAAEAMATAKSFVPIGAKAVGQANWKRAFAKGDPVGMWDALYEDEDPWNYGSAYEQEKYRRQIGLLPSGQIVRALELACAEGRFTEQLAPRVDTLIATDISQIAVDRAQRRCVRFNNIEFRPLNLVADPLPDDLDLIVCSEVLYFLSDVEVLRQTAARMAAAIRVGGSILLAHSFVLRDDPAKTGFDWGNPFGAKTISQIFAGTAGLSLEHTLSTELYRIDRFTKTIDAAITTPIAEAVAIEAPIDTEVARHVIWDGAVVTRSDAKKASRTSVPVLMYHRISDDGPERQGRYRIAPDRFREQLRWLRRHGFYSMKSAELEWFLRHRHPIQGRPIVLTFDDGYQDFADLAWPILQQSDFGAEVFVVSDLVGRTSAWDAAAGGAFPLLDAEAISRLHVQGVNFGSHLASHRAADGIATVDLANELLRSRAFLERWTGAAPTSFAPPHGATDQRTQFLAAECGFTVGFGTHPGLASFDSDPMNLPRLEVRGDWSMAQFMTTMEACLDE